MLMSDTDTSSYPAPVMSNSTTTRHQCHFHLRRHCFHRRRRRFHRRCYFQPHRRNLIIPRQDYCLPDPLLPDFQPLLTLGILLPSFPKSHNGGGADDGNGEESTGTGRGDRSRFKGEDDWFCDGVDGGDGKLVGCSLIHRRSDLFAVWTLPGSSELIKQINWTNKTQRLRRKRQVSAHLGPSNSDSTDAVESTDDDTVARRRRPPATNPPQQYAPD
ncbi:hypothetical protein R3P38DRAFT_3260759 [Favolaschia claudopus]|uniref:Uncharacterized protein n=1 Tax=Favolaschia claudopus TaxID=2862362 RepID=A0AAW0CVN6_9AGAR